jgi:hypothetical protein
VWGKEIKIKITIKIKIKSTPEQPPTQLLEIQCAWTSPLGDQGLPAGQAGVRGGKKLNCGVE